MHGQFIWYELTTPDVDAAKKFYPRFTGWGTQAFDNDYTMWTTGGVPMAGLFRLRNEMRQQGIPPNWMPYVESTTSTKRSAKAVSLGGRLVQGPDDIPGTGRFAVLQRSPGGGVRCLQVEPGRSGWDGTAVVGRFSWHELMTTDRVAAFAFYRALFGWENQWRDGHGQRRDVLHVRTRREDVRRHVQRDRRHGRDAARSGSCTST
jgi:predicted enzyme related to lactoylglutathione lyase